MDRSLLPLFQPQTRSSAFSPPEPRRSKRVPKTVRLRTGTLLNRRILDFDIEARATGYGDPNWVPQECTCIAWSWVGDDRVKSAVRLNGAEQMLGRFRCAYDEADMVIGHNILRFDLPVLNAEMLRFGLGPLPAKRAHDTLRHMVKTKGMKRDQENLGKLRESRQDKQHMSWQDWQDAYAEPGWKGIRSRAETDVIAHKEIWRGMCEDGWLKEARIWRP